MFYKLPALIILLLVIKLEREKHLPVRKEVPHSLLVQNELNFSWYGNRNELRNQNHLKFKFNSEEYQMSGLFMHSQQKLR